jgi:predicted O-methyltransferase YrrM
MKIKNIKEKLKEIDFNLSEVALGDFDLIGEYCAKKNRDANSELYKSAGCFFRPNYERGILVYALITKYNLKSFLEVGFGRGYSSFCAHLAFSRLNIDGKVTTIDINFDQKAIQRLFDNKIFPRAWLEKTDFLQGKSNELLPSLKEKYDLILLDGDHSEEGVRLDWENVKDKFNKFVIFDDYHLPPKNDPGIQVTPVVDSIEGYNKEAIVMDRQIFVDDRIGYNTLDAQVLLSHE